MESTYEIGSQSSNSVSFGTSVGGSAEVIGNEISVEAGFAMDWDEDFEDSVQTTYSSTFMAGAYDTIVIQRTPQTTYTYELYDYANDKWSGTYYCVTVPMRPVFYQLSVEEYNLYAKEYNDTVTGSQLALVDSSILPENNEGNPSAYYSSWGSAGTGNKNLSNSTYALSYNAGSISSEWSEEVSHTAAISIEHGFNFTVSLSVGLEILDTGGTVDSSVSIAYSHGTGSYKTTTKAGGACGTVCGIDRAALINNGYDINAVTQYGFNWQFGTWSRNMLGDGKDIPVFGYVINNITRAANPITTLTAENNKDTDKAVTVSWDAPINDMNVTIQGYKVYRKSFDQESYTMVRDTASERTFTDKGLSTYLIYSYYVTAVYKDNDLNITYESIPSNIVTIIVAANETIDVHDGVDGADGTDGREIELYVDNGFIKWRYTGSADDNILIRISDLMGENGTNGINGADGISVKKASIDNDGYLVITYSNDYSENTGLVVGKDGIGIQDIRINSFGELYIVLTDNRVFNLGKIIGKDGKDGIDGKDGTNGLDGTNGTDGKDGTNGMDGNDGKDGTNGMDGNDGKDGINGTNGKDDSVGDNVTEVKDGKSGTNGSDGSDGHNGINGTNGVGISNLAVNRKGYLMVTLTDGSVINAGYVFTKEKVTTEYKTKTVMIYSAFAMSTASLTGNVIALVFQLLKRRKLGL